VFLLYLVPLTPTSLSTTALQMFEVTLALAVLLAMASSKHESDASVPLVRAATSIEPHPQKLPLARLTR